MSSWFFLSYARLNRNDYLDRFYADLCQEILLLENLKQDEIGFFDTETIKTGDPWKQSLSNALCTSRVLVSLCSPGYSNSDYCGKEFQVFYERQQDYLATYKQQNPKAADTPRVIFPILWGPPRDEFPEVIKALQYTDNKFPAEYARDGLLQLMRLSEYKDKYTKFVRALAEKLVEAGKKYEMLELKNLRPLEKVDSAFVQSVPAAPAPNKPSPSSGRRNAKFVFVAPRSDELTGLKDEVECYGDEGGANWQPYWPEDEDPVFVVAQEAATKLKLFFRELPLDDQLEENLKQAEQNKEIVMIIVDAWSVQVEKYKEMIRPYDKLTSLNCALLVPWNELDQETKDKRAILEQEMKKTFNYKTKVSQGIYFQDAIRSAVELREGLLKTMSQIRSDIINSLINSQEPKPVIESAVLVQEARDKGIILHQPPVVAVPTGR